MPDTIHTEMLDLLAASIRNGTGRQANIAVDAFGKTGTTSDSKDALFMGFAQGLVVGVWVGNDDNSANPGLSGGGVPARVWRDFMTQALNLAPAAPPPTVDDEAVDPDSIQTDVDNAAGSIAGAVQGLGLDLHLGNDGSITLGRGRERDRDREAPPPEDRRPEDGPPDRE